MRILQLLCTVNVWLWSLQETMQSIAFCLLAYLSGIWWNMTALHWLYMPSFQHLLPCDHQALWLLNWESNKNNLMASGCVSNKYNHSTIAHSSVCIASLLKGAIQSFHTQITFIDIRQSALWVIFYWEAGRNSKTPVWPFICSWGLQSLLIQA